MRDFTPHDIESQPFFYTFTIQCSSCREEHSNPVSINRFEKHEIPGSRGEANLVWRCRNCKRQASAQIVEDKAGSLAETNTDARRGLEIIKIDCRGMTLLDFKADESGEWTAKGAESTSEFKIAAADLAEGEWFDYDEKAGEEVSVKEVKFEIVKA